MSNKTLTSVQFIAPPVRLYSMVKLHIPCKHKYEGELIITENRGMICEIIDNDDRKIFIIDFPSGWHQAVSRDEFEVLVY